MQAQTIYSKEVIRAVESIQMVIDAIRDSYFREIDMSSATSCQKAERTIRNMKADYRILALQKEIENIYICAAPVTVICCETEEEKRIMKKKFAGNESN